MLSLWETRADLPQPIDEAFHLRIGERLLTLGQPARAYDVLAEGIGRFPDSSKLAYLTSLALARGGSAARAGEVLRELRPRLAAGDPLLVEVLSLFGRLAKDASIKLPPGDERRAAENEAAKYYGEAYAISGDYFPGINAATMSFMAGHGDDAQRIARQVRRHCLDLAEQVDAGDHWLPATLGEASLLVGDPDDAADWYAVAIERAGRQPGDVGSMRRQIKLLGSRLELGPRLHALLAQRRVVVFTGHMIDRPDRPIARFPPSIEAAVAEEIRGVLDRLEAAIGFGSAACGADVLFAEALLRRGAEVNLVIPFRLEDFIETSVAFAGPNWVKRVEAIRKGASRVSHAIEEGYLGDDILFEYAADQSMGEALLRAEQMAAEVAFVAVIDSESEDRTGGTVACVDAWKSAGKTVEIVDLAAIRHGLGAGGRGARATRPTADARDDRPGRAVGLDEAWGRREIKVMLFADMVGFSKIAEQDAPAFFVRFLGEIAKTIDASKIGPVFQNSWGDGLFLVFDDLDAAARFALHLRDTVVGADWEKRGLPTDTNIRISMHAGPVFRALDPIIKCDNFFGSHVNRAARIEPVTAPGAVYVSEQTAALVATRGQSEFACDYMGTVMLAKKFGDAPLFRLRRVGEVE